MSIALVVTRGYGNGTYNGSIADVSTRGYTIGAEVTPTAEPEPEVFTGGFFFQFEQELLKSEEKKRQELALLEENAEKITNELDKQLNQAFQKQIIEKAKIDEYQRVRRLVEIHKKQITNVDYRLRVTIERAIQKQTFSALEALTREIKRIQEEEQALKEAAMLLL